MLRQEPFRLPPQVIEICRLWTGLIAGIPELGRAEVEDCCWAREQMDRVGVRLVSPTARNFRFPSFQQSLSLKDLGWCGPVGSLMLMFPSEGWWSQWLHHPSGLTRGIG